MSHGGLCVPVGCADRPTDFVHNPYHYDATVVPLPEAEPQYREPFPYPSQRRNEKKTAAAASPLLKDGPISPSCCSSSSPSFSNGFNNAMQHSNTFSRFPGTQHPHRLSFATAGPVIPREEIMNSIQKLLMDQEPHPHFGHQLAAPKLFDMLVEELEKSAAKYCISTTSISSVLLKSIIQELGSQIQKKCGGKSPPTYLVKFVEKYTREYPDVKTYKSKNTNFFVYLSNGASDLSSRDRKSIKDDVPRLSVRHLKKGAKLQQQQPSALVELPQQHAGQ